LNEFHSGGFSIVREGLNKETGEKVAIKIIEKNQANPEELNLLHREIDIMKKLHHKNIIELIDVFDEPTHIYLVLEL
jgi:serine/threonine protein kinase